MIVSLNLFPDAATHLRTLLKVKAYRKLNWRFVLW